MAQIRITGNVTNREIKVSTMSTYLDILGDIGGGTISLSYKNAGYLVPFSDAQAITELGEGYELILPGKILVVTLGGATNPNLIFKTAPLV